MVSQIYPAPLDYEQPDYDLEETVLGHNQEYAVYVVVHESQEAETEVFVYQILAQATQSAVDIAEDRSTSEIEGENREGALLLVTYSRLGHPGRVWVTRQVVK